MEPREKYSIFFLRIEANFRLGTFYLTVILKTLCFASCLLITHGWGRLSSSLHYLCCVTFPVKIWANVWSPHMENQQQNQKWFHISLLCETNWLMGPHTEAEQRREVIYRKICDSKTATSPWDLTQHGWGLKSSTSLLLPAKFSSSSAENLFPLSICLWIFLTLGMGLLNLVTY